MKNSIMKTEDPARLDQKKQRQFTPLAKEQRTHVTTDHCAYLLNRQPQTLRLWAMCESGPLRPIRVNGRLAWPVCEICGILGVQNHE